jgi:hypothetical protein
MNFSIADIEKEILLNSLRTANLKVSTNLSR